MSKEYQYDENVARNISPERQSSNGSSISSTSESSQPSEDEETSHSTLHRKAIDKAGFHIGKTRDEDKDVEAWHSRPCFSYFTFAQELLQSKPKDNDNIKGICKKCFKTCSGQVRSTSNWVRHIKVM